MIVARDDRAPGSPGKPHRNKLPANAYDEEIVADHLDEFDTGARTGSRSATAMSTGPLDCADDLKRSTVSGTADGAKRDARCRGCGARVYLAAPHCARVLRCPACPKPTRVGP